MGEGNNKLGLQHRAINNAGLPLRDRKGTVCNALGRIGEETLALGGVLFLGDPALEGVLFLVLVSCFFFPPKGNFFGALIFMVLSLRQVPSS